jgi:hypothetical protein
METFCQGRDCLHGDDAYGWMYYYFLMKLASNDQYVLNFVINYLT